jgi:hypothetical protein
MSREDGHVHVAAPIITNDFIYEVIINILTHSIFAISVIRTVTLRQLYQICDLQATFKMIIHTNSDGNISKAFYCLGRLDSCKTKTASSPPEFWICQTSRPVTEDSGVFPVELTYSVLSSGGAGVTAPASLTLEAQACHV